MLPSVDMVRWYFWYDWCSRSFARLLSRIYSFYTQMLTFPSYLLSFYTTSCRLNNTKIQSSIRRMFGSRTDVKFCAVVMRLYISLVIVNKYHKKSLSPLFSSSAVLTFLPLRLNQTEFFPEDIHNTPLIVNRQINGAFGLAWNDITAVARVSCSTNRRELYRICKLHR